MYTKLNGHKIHTRDGWPHQRPATSSQTFPSPPPRDPWAAPTDRQMRVKAIIIGPTSVGKTAVINAIIGNDFKEHIVPTIGVDFALKKFDIDNHTAVVQLWDTAGQERFRSISAAFYRGAHVVIFMYDVMRPPTMQAVEHFVHDWKDNHDASSDRDKPVMIMVGNKDDGLSDAPRVSQNDGQRFACEMGKLTDTTMEFMHTSAKTNRNIDALFDIMSRQGYENRLRRPDTRYAPLLPPKTQDPSCVCPCSVM